MRKFISRFYKALTFSAIGLFFILHWALIQKDANPADYLAITGMVAFVWVLDYFNQGK